MLLALALAADVFFAHGPYDGAIPKPDTILSYAAGKRHTFYMDQERVVQAIASKGSARVKLIPIGFSTEGRPLRALAISSPENIKRLDQIQADIQTLADGTLKPELIAKTPVIVWINETIHGNESASFESGMWLIYNLVASRSPQTTKMLQDAVVIVNPCYNPDGHERFVVWYNSVARGDADPSAFEAREPRIIHGRTNHYRFDMNRDRLSMSQVETRQEVAAFLKWNPQVYVDQHGQVENYFFPPTAMSVHKNVRERYNKWTDVLGRATGKAFDDLGFNYYVKDIFDFYAPVYLDAWATFSGAIGMTHETNTSLLARTDSDGKVNTLRDGMERHFTSALAVIGSAAANREAFLQSFAEFKERNANGQTTGDRRFFVAQSAERGQVERMKRILDVSNIKSEVTTGKAEFSGESLWSSKSEAVAKEGHFLVVPMAQPQATLALTLFQTESDFEPEFVKEQLRRREARKASPEYGESEEFYDLTGWSMPMLHGMKAWWSTAKPNIAERMLKRGEVQDSTIGWAILPGEANTLAVLKLLGQGVRVSLSAKAMKLGDQEFPAGTYLVLTQRNEKDVYSKVKGSDAIALTTAYPEGERFAPGSESVMRLRAGRLGILFGDESSPSQFGGAWYVVEKELGLPFTAIGGAPRGNLDSYSAILAPEGADVSSAKLKEWVQDGGCLVLLGGDPTRGGYIKLDRQSAVGQPGNVPGSLFRAQIDPRSFLSYGYPRDTDGKVRLASFVGGTSFYRANGDGSVWTIVDEEKSLVSGWTWPDETEKAVRGTVAAQVERSGQGRVIWFAQDPTERAMYAGHWQMLLNAIAIGPSP